MSATEPRTAEPFVDGLDFGEGPRWHEGRLWYSDFYRHTVFSVGPEGDRRSEVELSDQPSGLGWLPDGRLLVVSMAERVVLRREPDGSLVVHGDLKPWATGLANDMVVAADGRAYVGNFGFDLEALYAGGPDAPRPTTTSMIRVDPDGSAVEAATDLAFPNGTVIFPGGRLLVVGESFGFQMTAFDIDADGSLTNRRVWAPLEGVAPDGCCLDAEGCIWVANAAGRECVRVAEGGRVLDRVTTELHTYACMLGGPEGTTLYCVTAPSSDPPKVRGMGAGRIVQAQVEVPGAGLP